MATKAEELAALAKAARAAKAAGPSAVEAFVSGQRRERAQAAPSQDALNASHHYSVVPETTPSAAQRKDSFSRLAAFGASHRDALGNAENEAPVDGEAVAGKGGSPGAESAGAAPAPAAAADSYSKLKEFSIKHGLGAPSAHAPAPAAPVPPSAGTERKEDTVVVNGKRVPLYVAPRPTGAPDPAWSDPSIPAGSNYTAAEWAAARKPGHYLVEVRSGSEGALYHVGMAVPPPNSTARVVGGKLQSKGQASVDPDANDKGLMSPFEGHVVDGCMLLSPTASTSHPHAAQRCGTLTIENEDGAQWVYRIVRPDSHRQDDFKRFLFTLSSVAGSPFMRAPKRDRQIGQANVEPSTPSVDEAASNDVEARDFERERG